MLLNENKYIGKDKENKLFESINTLNIDVESWKMESSSSLSRSIYNNLIANPFYLPYSLESSLLKETPIESQIILEPPTFENDLCEFQNITPLSLSVEANTPTEPLEMIINSQIQTNYQIQTPITANILDVFETKTPLINEAETPKFFKTHFVSSKMKHPYHLIPKLLLN